MTAIWAEDSSGWRLLKPSGFPLEATLHDLVADAPNLLPLSGGPRIVVVGREVPLPPAGLADLIALESSGRVVVIEVKLATNAEARRAVVAQALSYAAVLRGMSIEAFESRMAKSGYSLADADVDRDGVAESLRTGRFRVVLVLDDAPEQLRMLVGYLEAMTDGLTLDLITVSPFEVGGQRIVVPQRISPEQQEAVQESPIDVTSHRPAKVPEFPGTDEFVRRLERAPEDRRAAVLRIVEFVKQLDSAGLAASITRTGETYTTLVPTLPWSGAGLFLITLESMPMIHASVIRKVAPVAADALESGVSTSPGAKRRFHVPFDELEALLPILRQAYEEAARTRLASAG